MPRILTRDFGPLEYATGAELRFPRGLPGFEAETRFVLMEREALTPFVFLQSVVTSRVCFLTVPVQVVEPGYQIGMTEEDGQLVQAGLGAAELLCLAVLASNGAGAFTANLLAPLVVNPETKIGVQAVRPDSRYSHRHPLPEETVCS
jgi:flagellar assembly factor FliW